MKAPSPSRPFRTLNGLVLSLCILSLLLGNAQARQVMAPSPDCAAALGEGANAVRQKAWEQAKAVLHPVYDATPGCYTQEEGAVAYWLGKAYEGSNESSTTRIVWQQGYSALREQGHFDARLAEEYLQLVSRTSAPTFEEQATVIYMDLMAEAGPDTPGWALPVMRRQMAYLAPLLDSQMLGQVVEGRTPEAWQFREGSGEWLATWWRQQDPIPATTRNERIIEHLRRVTEARQKYADPGRFTGYDDRGETYVRFGEPDKIEQVLFNDLNFLREVVRLGVSVQPSDFPKNEIWLYPHVDWSGSYIFIENAGVYRLATATDLLPAELRTGYNSSVRSHNKAFSAIAALRYIYSELSLYYSTFGNLLGELDGLYSLQKDLQNILEDQAMRGEATEVGVNTGEGNVAEAVEERGYLSLAGFASQTPSSAITGFINQSNTQERHLNRQREERMPEQYTEVLRNVVTLPVAVRTARFLDEDGSTRTEIYWGVEADALAPTQGQQQQISQLGLGRLDHLLRLSVVQRAANYEARLVNVNHVLVPDGESHVPVQTATVRGDRGLYHLGLQWDQYLVRPNEAQQPVVQLRLTTGASDSLHALKAEPGRLEMSDLKPLLVLNDSPDLGPDNTQPYPATTITRSTQLALYFEVYHLMLSDNDEARFTVAYEVRRRGEPGLLRFLGRNRDETTSTRVSYRSEERTAREYILLDLSEWEGSGEVEITLRVTDEATGSQVSRNIHFELAR